MVVHSNRYQPKAVIGVILEISQLNVNMFIWKSEDWKFEIIKTKILKTRETESNW